jgi:hypothetical protein
MVKKDMESMKNSEHDARDYLKGELEEKLREMISSFHSPLD